MPKRGYAFFLTASPALSCFNGPSAAAMQAATVIATLDATEATTCVMTGKNIIEQLNRDRYTFRGSRSITTTFPRMYLVRCSGGKP